MSTDFDSHYQDHHEAGYRIRLHSQEVKWRRQNERAARRGTLVLRTLAVAALVSLVLAPFHTLVFLAVGGILFLWEVS